MTRCVPAQSYRRENWRVSAYWGQRERVHAPRGMAETQTRRLWRQRPARRCRSSISDGCNGTPRTPFREGNPSAADETRREIYFACNDGTRSRSPSIGSLPHSQEGQTLYRAKLLRAIPLISGYARRCTSSIRSPSPSISSALYGSCRNITLLLILSTFCKSGAAAWRGGFVSVVGAWRRMVGGSVMVGDASLGRERGQDADTKVARERQQNASCELWRSDG